MHPANQQIVSAITAYQKAKDSIMADFYANMKRIKTKGMKEIEALMSTGEKAEMKKIEKELE